MMLEHTYDLLAVTNRDFNIEKEQFGGENVACSRTATNT
jgi:hypothetical protein